MTKLPRPTFTAALGLSVLGLTIGVALFAPILAPHALNDVVGGNWDPPSAKALLGTDNLGRDMLSRLIWGTRVTLSVAAIATFLAFLIGGLSGFIAGVFGGWIDLVLGGINDLLMAVPTLIFALVVLTVLPSGFGVIVGVMALLDSTRVFRISRSLAADIAAMDYIEAARVRGEGLGWILAREILPNAISPLLAEFGLRLVFAILFLSTLSFLGLGIQPPSTDWGSLLKENKDAIVFGGWSALVPGAAIALLALAISSVVDWALERTTSTGTAGADG
jgi:peptide/nickel transport system permease protein